MVTTILFKSHYVTPYNRHSRFPPVDGWSNLDRSVDIVAINDKYLNYIYSPPTFPVISACYATHR